MSKTRRDRSLVSGVWRQQQEKPLTIIVVTKMMFDLHAHLTVHSVSVMMLGVSVDDVACDR